MPTYKLILLLASIIFTLTTCRTFKFSFTPDSNECKSKDSLYVVPYYSDYKKRYARLFRKVAKDRVSKCLCGKFDNKFGSYKGYANKVIEPMYVNMQNCTGVYASTLNRSNPYLNAPRYVNGIHPHFIFLIDEGKLKTVPEDTVQLKKLLFHPTSNFAKIYSKEELNDIYKDIKSGRTGTKYITILAPCNIKDKGRTIYNVHKK